MWPTSDPVDGSAGSGRVVGVTVVVRTDPSTSGSKMPASMVGLMNDADVVGSPGPTGRRSGSPGVRVNTGVRPVDTDGFESEPRPPPCVVSWKPLGRLPNWMM
jgi:hypothetical protein